MCILCVASRWSRRIVTMLPWLIIPLIILWALSQLLPPGFRFEVTSPRLACVGVLLISLGWYELAMPRLSKWRTKRSALQKERRRIEAQEAAKWRKEATRRCRNCLSAYRDQTPGGGKFMCTFCGHISKRPVLDVPVGPEAVAPGSPLAGIPSTNGTGPGGGFSGSRTSRGWGGRGWPERGGWGSGGRGWTSSKSWVAASGPGWGSGSSGSWGTSNWSGRSWSAPGSAYWGGAGTAGGTWAGNGYGGGFFGGESCVAGEPHHGGLFFALFQGFSFILFGVRWMWGKLCRGERPGDDGGLNGRRRGGQRKGDEGGIPQGSRGDKARRKAEEKRQARLEREQLEAEERRQREEVARLVEERRRLRDEKLEAEKESEREAAAEREREVRREREAERRRQEKVKEREKEQAKEKPREMDSEDCRKKEKKDTDKKSDCERRGETERKGQNADLKKALKSSRGAAVDPAHKTGDAGMKVGNGGKVGSTRYVGPAKVTSPGTPKSSMAHLNRTSSFWGKGLNGGLNPGGKSAKGTVLAGIAPVASGGSSAEVPKGKPADSSYSTWNRMPWTKVWGKNNVSIPEGNVAPQTGSLGVNGRTDLTNQSGERPCMDGSSGSGAPDLLKVKVKQSTAVTSQPRSWQRLFLNANVSSPATPDVDHHQEHQRREDDIGVPEESESVPLDTETTIFFGDGFQGSPVAKPPVVAPLRAPVHLPALPFVPMSPPSTTSGLTTTVFTPVNGTSNMPPFTLPPSLAPNPIGKPVQMPVHPPVSSPPHMPAPIQLPVPLTSQNQSHVPQDQLPQILEPWGQPPLSLNDPIEASVGDKWQMWDSPQLDQIQLSSIAEPMTVWNYVNNSFVEVQKGPLRPLTQSLEPENQLPSSLFSPHPITCPSCTTGDLLGPLPPSNSQSLWSDQSAFESTMRIWDDSDSHQRIPPPPEFVDCITQEVMKDPVITADGHSYERAAIERWLRTHDTSPITGEVLPATPGGYGTGVDKTLRPNHILRGQIIEYRENVARLARGSMQESSRDNSWSMGVGLGCSAWSTERTQIGAFYTTPAAQSLWSYDRSQNPVLPPL